MDSRRGFFLAKYDKLKLLLTAYLRHWRLGDEAFTHVHTYCAFVGHARSGHTLVGSLLDAHPNLLISHELNALAFVRRRFSRQLLYHLIWARSLQFNQGGPAWEGYSYHVPGQWQGQFQNLQVIGDKKATLTTMLLQSTPGLLETLSQTVGCPVKFVHVIRNPYDNISTINRRQFAHIPLVQNVADYFERCQTIADLNQQINREDILDIQFERFVNDPQATLSQICQFLGVPAPEDYLEACANIVFKSPKRTRDLIEWPAELRQQIVAGIEQFDFLHGYSFDE